MKKQISRLPVNQSCESGFVYGTVLTFNDSSPELNVIFVKLLQIRIWDPGSNAFFYLGIRDGKKIWNRNINLVSYFQKISNNFWVKNNNSVLWIRIRDGKIWIHPGSTTRLLISSFVNFLPRGFLQKYCLFDRIYCLFFKIT
jgi:hypothetical protein